jgi:hypothetical protein
VNCVEPDTTELPVGVHTTTATVPAISAGVVAVICVLLLTVKLAALMPSNCTSDAPVKLLPVMTTVVPPAVLPEVVPRLLMAGADAALYVKRPLLVAADVPAVVTTTTSMVPAVLAGEVAVICVPETMVKLAAATLPKYTATAPPRSVPLMVTLVPPAVLPDDVPRLVMTGALAALNV